jgi:PAS domain S-box-containing protein
MSDGLLLDALLANTADGACAVGADGKIFVWNRAAEKMLGYPAREVVGRPCADVFAARDDAGNRLCYAGCHVRTLLQREEPVHHFDMATRTRAGKPVWLDVSILTVPGGRGASSVTVHLFRDVTASREIESLVRERLARASAPPADGADGGRSPLTRREVEILRLLGAGANTRSIAARLNVSGATVRNHVQNILGKLGVHSRLEAVAHASRNGLLPADPGRPR